ncbi:hypothetical protein KVR01_008739 [Diaporthe batatas]|uniref:uncharacterized protein n=1 Tax=Diaporthe batatas TaxID=748121 RepID=UPI001D03D9CF|nr:uncharacterized protein KVR01_008739 [Diaporthe batatas]KAG8161752.1 hypothetical protein KVR01_008739 [Diaporthe batatas]
MSTASPPNSPTSGNILWNWVSNSTASQSDEFATQITCYAFPYGALGFLAHLVMFYGIALSSLNKCPWRPSKPLSHSALDMIFGIVGLVISCLFASVTIYRCSGAPQYILIALSQIFVTITSLAIGISIAWNIRGTKKESDNKAESDSKAENDSKAETKLTHYKALWWFIVEFLGSIMELVGVVMVLKEADLIAVDKTKQSVLTMSLIFAGFMGLLFGIGFIWLELRQCAQRRMEWEMCKVQAKCTLLEERLEAQQPRGRPRNRRRDTSSSNERDRRSPVHNNGRESARRRSGQHQPTRGVGNDAASHMGQERDLEAQRLLSSSGEAEAPKEPVLYHYQDVLNSAKQILIMAGAAFSLSVTLYTDWILAAVSGSYLGFPTTGNVPLTVVYVLFYFFVRLIPVITL